MLIDKEVEKRPFHSCAPASVKPASGTADFCTSLVVDHAEAFAKLYMILEREDEGGLFTKISDRFVLLLTACTNVIIGKVRKRKKKCLLLIIQFTDNTVALFDFCYKLLHLCHDLACIAAGLFDLGNLLACSILFSLHCFNNAHLLTLLCIYGKDLINDTVKIHFSFFNFSLYFIGFFSEVFDIDHFKISFYQICFIISQYGANFHTSAQIFKMLLRKQERLSLCIKELCQLTEVIVIIEFDFEHTAAVFTVNDLDPSAEVFIQCQLDFIKKRFSLM